MRDLGYLATPHLEGRCVKTDQRMHGLFKVRRVTPAIPPMSLGRDA